MLWKKEEWRQKRLKMEEKGKKLCEKTRERMRKANIGKEYRAPNTAVLSRVFPKSLTTKVKEEKKDGGG